MTDFITLMIIYITIGTAIAVYAARMRVSNSQDSYFIGSRGISWIVGALTYAATTYSSFMMVGLIGLSYSTGLGALIFEMVYLFSTIILLSIYGKRIWKISQDENLVSPMELFSSRFGKATGIAGALVSAGALIPYTAAQVIGLSIIFGYFGVSYGQGVGVAAVLICIWSLVGGLRGVVLTDAVQGLFMIGAAVAAAFWAGDSFGGIEFSTFPNTVWTPVFFINITLPWAFFALTNPQVTQRLFIINDSAGLRKMIILFALVGTVYTLICCYIGFAAKYGSLAGNFVSTGRRDDVIIGIIDTMSRGMGLAVALSIVFASISTSNSIILTLSSMMTRDVMDDRSGILFGRLFIVVMTFFVALFALQKTAYIVELSVSTSRILMCFLPLFFDIFHFRKGGKITGVLTIVGGALAAVIFGETGLALSSVYTLAVCFICYFVGIILDRNSR